MQYEFDVEEDRRGRLQTQGAHSEKTAPAKSCCCCCEFRATCGGFEEPITCPGIDSWSLSRCCDFNKRHC